MIQLVQQAKRRMRQTQANSKDVTRSNHMVKKKWTLTQTQTTRMKPEFWCIFTKLLAGINLIQIKEKLSEKISLIFKTISILHHCVFRFISPSINILWYKNSFFVKQTPCESMFGYEAKGRSTHAIIRYWSVCKSLILRDLKCPLGTFINNCWTQQGSLQFGSILWKCSGGTSAKGTMSRTAKTTVSTFVSTKNLSDKKQFRKAECKIPSNVHSVSG